METPTSIAWRDYSRFGQHPIAAISIALALCAAWALVPVATARGVGIDDIPDPRPAGWTVDLAGKLPAETVAELNRLGDEVKRQTGSELAIVVVGSTDGADPRQFATDLFNRWGVGAADKNDGVLVFAALDDRAAEIILGDGIDDDAQVSVADRIMQEQMVPRFRAGDPAGAVLAGARACAEQILRLPTENGALAALSPADFGEEAAESESAEPELVRGEANWAPRKRNSSGGAWAALLGLIGVTGAGGLWWGLRRYLRFRPKPCRHCQGEVVLLDEAADDQHLSKAEQIEERLGSANYDVWHCPKCQQVTKVRYGAFFSRYSLCPGCGAQTKTSTTTTIQAATYDSGGIVQIDERCEHCAHLHTATQSTPQLMRPSTRPHRFLSTPHRGSMLGFRSSRSSGFGGGGRSSGRGASGRSGGRSSGRGASGRW